MEQKIFNRRDEILNNISKATLEEVSQILDYYKSSQVLNSGTVDIQPIIVDGVTYHFKYNPQEAASLNARYRELTGHDHPVFLEEQAKVLDLLLSNKDELARQGYLTMQIDVLERLRESLAKDKSSINVISTAHPFLRKDEIMLDLSKATLEEVSQILDYYKSSQVLNSGAVDIQPIIVDGVTYHFKYNPQEAASLNARYRELTGGYDHPVFLEEQAKVLDLLLSNKDELARQGYLTTQVDTLERLRANLTQDTTAIEVIGGRKNHILTRFNEILKNLQEANLDDITSLLNYYNGQPVIIDGVTHHPFNDPVLAYKLNIRYRELTGHDHPIFVNQALIVIDNLIKNKDMLLKYGAYPPEYFDKLEKIRNDIDTKLDSKPKKR